jgi:ABC-type multidrug transport system permease subunit
MGPIVFVLVLTYQMIQGETLRDELAAYRPAAVLLGWLKISALALPTVAMLSIGMHLLGKLRRDSFLIAFAIGTILVCVGIGITTFVTVGPSPDIDFDDPDIRYEAVIVVAIVLAISALLSVLYWLFAVRRDRSRRLLAEIDVQAIRAME